MQFGSVGTDGRTVALQKLATLSLGADAALPQCCVAQHVPDRHPGRLQTTEKLDPGQDRCVVIPMARLVAVSIGQQPDPLIVTNRMCCQSRAFRQFTNLHEHPSRSTTQRKLRVRARSKSRGNRITVIRAPARRTALSSSRHPSLVRISASVQTHESDGFREGLNPSLRADVHHERHSAVPAGRHVAQKPFRTFPPNISDSRRGLLRWSRYAKRQYGY